MPIYEIDGQSTQIGQGTWVAPSAEIIGNVEIGENSSVWPGAVIRGDFDSIRIGRNCHIEDNSVLHGGTTVDIGDDVIIGHSAVIHGLRIGDNVLVGNNATVLDFAEIGDHCIIGANSMVSAGQKIPSNSFVVGVPAEIKRELSSDKMKEMHRRMAVRYSQIAGKEMPTLSYSDLAKKYKEQGL